MTTARILIVDDEPLIRDALSDLLDTEDGLEVLATAGNIQDAVAAAVAQRPDVVLIDVRMADGGGPEGTRRILELVPTTTVVALSAYDDQESVFEMLRAGARGYLLKGGPPAAITDAIAQVLDGGIALSPTVADKAIATFLPTLGQSVRGHSDASGRPHLGSPSSAPLLFQPVIDLKSRRVVGLEATAPWQGLDIESARAAVRAAASLPDPLFLSLNASLELILSTGVLDLLAAGPAERIVVALSERVLVTDMSASLAAAEVVRKAGARLALTNAGASAASLRALLELDPDVLKLDPSLTADDRGARWKIASALVQLACQLDADVAAEGIRRDSDLDRMLALGIGFGQGPLWGVPAQLETALASADGLRPGATSA